MQQTECRQTRQMKKDRLQMLLLPPLVLLMAIQVTFACQCEEINWERVMCPGEGKTVLLGGAISEFRVGSLTSSEIMVFHQLRVERVFKEAPNKLTWSKEDTLTMLTPDKCSHSSSEEDGMYLIYGVTDVGGVLQSSNCTMENIRDFNERSDCDKLHDIVWGIKAPQC